MSNEIDLFIYGTLLRGEYNRGKLFETGFSVEKDSLDSIVAGLLLISNKEKLPLALPNSESSLIKKPLYHVQIGVKGEILTLSSENISQSLIDLDSFEGVFDPNNNGFLTNGWYKRIILPSLSNKVFSYFGNKLKLKKELQKGLILPKGDYKFYSVWEEFVKPKSIENVLNKSGTAMGLETECNFTDGKIDLGNIFLQTPKGITIGYDSGNRTRNYSSLTHFLSELLYSNYKTAAKGKILRKFFKSNRKNNGVLPGRYSLFTIEGEWLSSRSEESGLYNQEPSTRRICLDDERYFEIVGLPLKATKGFATLLAETEIKSRNSLEDLISSIEYISKRNHPPIDIKHFYLEGHSTQYNITVDSTIDIGSKTLDLNSSSSKIIPPKDDFYPKLSSEICYLLSYCVGGPFSAMTGDISSHSIKFGTFSDGRIEIRGGTTNSLDQLKAINLLTFGSVQALSNLIKTYTLIKSSKGNHKLIDSLSPQEILETYTKIKVEELTSLLPFVIDSSQIYKKKIPTHKPCFEFPSERSYAGKINEDPYNLKIKINPINVFTFDDKKTQTLTEITGVEMLREIVFNPYFRHSFEMFGTKEELKLLDSYALGETNFENNKNKRFSYESILNLSLDTSSESFPSNWQSFYTHFIYENGGRIIFSNAGNIVAIGVDSLYRTSKDLAPHKLNVVLSLNDKSFIKSELNIENYSEVYANIKSFQSGDMTPKGLYTQLLRLKIPE